MDKYQFHVYYADVNGDKRMKLDLFEGMILNASCRASDEGGFGIPDLNQTNRTWVLARFALNIIDFPRLNDEIEIETWIEQNMMGFSIRDFAIYRLHNGAEREHIADSKTTWAVIDLTTRQNVNLADIPNFPQPEPRKAVIPAMPRIDREAETEEHPYIIQYSDIDQNGHCNSARYVQMMLNAYNHLEGMNAKCFQVSYSHEVRFGEPVRIVFTKGVNPYFRIINRDGQVAVSAQFVTE